MPPHPLPLPTERKVEKGPLFAQNDPPHKNPGYGPVLHSKCYECLICAIISIKLIPFGDRFKFVNLYYI